MATRRWSPEDIYEREYFERPRKRRSTGMSWSPMDQLEWQKELDLYQQFKDDRSARADKIKKDEEKNKKVELPKFSLGTVTLFAAGIGPFIGLAEIILLMHLKDVIFTGIK